ncbi:MAG TPA: hypothetical protein VFY23_05930 [Candidatus Limnocylindrales bacterium]|nr:hypothetical protein [Candidatus Limnocylindrales bacterium]
MDSVLLLVLAVTFVAAFANLAALHGEDSREGFRANGPAGLA